MKWVLLASFVCNQHTYDRIYKMIIQQALIQPVNVETFKQRNQAIETLRELCKGQVSTYETPGKEVD